MKKTRPRHAVSAATLLDLDLVVSWAWGGAVYTVTLDNSPIRGGRYM